MSAHDKAIEAAHDAYWTAPRGQRGDLPAMRRAIATFLRAETEGHRNCYCRMCVTADELDGGGT